MMSVRWIRSALDELADLWLNAPNRKAVTVAVNAIDERLRKDAEHEGESRDEDRRILLEPPLGVVFIVKPRDRIALVVHVWYFEKRQHPF